MTLNTIHVIKKWKGSRIDIVRVPRILPPLSLGRAMIRPEPIPSALRSVLSEHLRSARGAALLESARETVVTIGVRVRICVVVVAMHVRGLAVLGAVVVVVEDAVQNAIFDVSRLLPALLQQTLVVVVLLLLVVVLLAAEVSLLVFLHMLVFL